jgi:hypothetical protein
VRGTDGLVGIVFPRLPEIIPLLISRIFSDTMCKRRSVEKSSVENIAREGYSIFRSFHPFVIFKIIPNNLRLVINTKKSFNICIEKNGVCDDIGKNKLSLYLTN